MKNAAITPKRILFLHPNFPAQFRHLATALAKDDNYQIVFTTNRQEGTIPGVHKVIYEPSRQTAPQTHHYVRNLERKCRSDWTSCISNRRKPESTGFYSRYNLWSFWLGSNIIYERSFSQSRIIMFL